MGNERDRLVVGELDIQYQAAVEGNDADTMNRILADDFVLVNGLGSVFTKEDLLTEARRGTVSYGRQEATDRTVRVWGDTAVVTALLWAKGVDNGETFQYKVWYSDTYGRTASGWRYLLGQASTRLPYD